MHCDCSSNKAGKFSEKEKKTNNIFLVSIQKCALWDYNTVLVSSAYPITKFYSSSNRSRPLQMLNSPGPSPPGSHVEFIYKMVDDDVDMDEALSEFLCWCDASGLVLSKRVS